MTEKSSYKSHTAITINTRALKHNLKVIRQRTGAAKIMAVVKANAYGHGLTLVSNALSDADGFAVFSLDEAITIRENFPHKPILWLAGFSTPRELAYAQEFKLISLLHHAEQIKIIEATSLSSPVDIFLKVNTGMNRLGFSPDAFPDVYQQLIYHTKIKKPFVLMTHLAQSEIADDPVTSQQIALFTRLTQHRPNPKSLANTAAIWAWPQAIGDYVRPGISLYGISPFKDRQGKDLGLKPVMTFRSKLIAINRCKKNARVGYGGIWRCPSDTHLGAIDIGYADGYSRHAKGGTPVLINGHIYPLVGRVSMNMITVNLGPKPKVNVNDEVTLWGEGLPVEEIARYSETIPYTLTTGVSSCIRRTVQV
jgi:alanine racemase